MIEVQHNSDEEVDDDCYLSLDIVSDDCDALIVEDPESIITFTSRKRSLCTDIRQDISLSQMQTHNLSADTNQQASTSKSMVQEDEIERYVCFNANYVRDEICEACAELAGHGFSYYECQIVLKVIANRLLRCTWTIPLESRGHV